MSSELKFHKGKFFKKYLSEKQIQESVADLATTISIDYSNRVPLFVGVLNGSFIFAGDLLRNLTINCEITFIKVASYSGTKSTGNVVTLIGLNEKLVEGRDIIIVEDIVDSGETIVNIVNSLNKMSPKSVKICTMFLKPDVYKKDLYIDYVAMQIKNDFVIGYGLDFDGYFRNLRDLYVLAPEF